MTGTEEMDPKDPCQRSVVTPAPEPSVASEANSGELNVADVDRSAAADKSSAKKRPVHRPYIWVKLSAIAAQIVARIRDGTAKKLHNLVETEAEALLRKHEEFKRQREFVEFESKLNEEAAQSALAWANAEAARANAKAAHANNFRTRMFTAFFAVAIGVFLFAVTQEMMRSSVVIEPFAVPEELVSQGYTPTVAANRLRDYMRAALDSAEFTMFRPEASDERVDAPVPVIGITVRTLAAYLREMLGISYQRVSGDITIGTRAPVDSAVDTLENGGEAAVPPREATENASEAAEKKNTCNVKSGDRFLRLVIRYSDGDRTLTDTIVCPNGEIESLLERGGQVAGYMTDPLTYAKLTFSIEKKEKARALPKTLHAIEAALKLTEGTAEYPLVYDLKGQALVQLGDIERAVEDFEKAASLISNIERPDSRHAWVHVNWGDAEAKRGSINVAAEQYRRALTVAEATTDHTSFEVFISVAERMNSQAVDVLRRASYVEDLTLNQHQRLGELLRGAGEKEMAVKQFAAASQKARNDSARASALVEWSRTLASMGRDEEVKQRITNKTLPGGKQFQSAARYHFVSGRILGEGLNEWEESLDYFEKTVDEGESEGLPYRVRALYHLGRHKEAIEAAEKALRHNENDSYALALWGSVLMELGEHENALAKFNEAKSRGFSLAWVDKGRIEALKKLRRYDEAEHVIASLTRDGPNRFKERGIMLGQELGLWDKALQYFQIAVDKGESKGMAHQVRALYHLGRHEEAVEAAELALSLNGDDYNALIWCVRALLALGEYQGALDKLTHAKTVGATATWVDHLKIMALEKLGRYDEAERIIRKHAADDPEWFTFWGDHLRSTGRYGDSIEKYEKHIHLNPNAVGPRIGMGRALLSLRRFDDAITELKEAIRYSRDFSYLATMFLGRAYFYSNRSSEAYQQFDLASREEPKDVFSVLWMNLARPEMRKTVEERADNLDLEAWPGPMLRLFLGELSVEELRNEARNGQERITAGRACEINFYIGQYHLQGGRRAAAIKALKLALETDAHRDHEYHDSELELLRIGD